MFCIWQKNSKDSNADVYWFIPVIDSNFQFRSSESLSFTIWKNSTRVIEYDILTFHSIEKWISLEIHLTGDLKFNNMK